MLDIVREHADWTGAIERALGGLRTTLLVPQEQYPRITRWLNQCHTGLHIRVQAVGSETKPAAFKSGGILEKLLWRNHPYCGWLDRKSTRLNSSHLLISYAVFCLKKKILHAALP